MKKTTDFRKTSIVVKNGRLALLALPVLHLCKVGCLCRCICATTAICAAASCNDSHLCRCIVQRLCVAVFMHPCITALCGCLYASLHNGFVWLTASILAWTWGGSPVNSAQQSPKPHTLDYTSKKIFNKTLLTY